VREAGFVSAMRALLDEAARSGADPFSRGHFAPGHFTASAFVSSADGGSVLLVHHAKLGLWVQPGGHFEPDDADLLSAARREVAEETGLTELLLPDGGALLDVDIHDIPALRGEPPHQHLDLRVHLRCAPGTDLRAIAGAGVRAVRWVPIEVDPEGSDDSVRRALARLRQRERGHQRRA
jgi:8-oxo-dGTP pyrophosphatase MutT (NUDIX family)